MDEAEIREAADRAAVLRRAEERQRREAAEAEEEVFHLGRQDAFGPQQPEAGVDMMRQFGHLLQEIAAQAANQAVQRQPPAPVRERDFKLKVPEFDGTGDVELFITQFQEVAELQEWGERITALKAREGLSGKARTCGQYESWEEIAGSLRLHYGITAADAGMKLNSLRKPPTQTLAEYGLEVRRLVAIAYEEAAAPLRQRIEMERFKSGLNNPSLQGHLLARTPESIEDAVIMGNEFLQLMKRTVPTLRTVETESSLCPEETQARPVSTTESLTKLLEACRKEMAGLKTEVHALKNAPRPTNPTNPTGPTRRSEEQPGCWGCHSEGHIRRDCPTKPWPKKTGNEGGPRQ